MDNEIKNNEEFTENQDVLTPEQKLHPKLPPVIAAFVGLFIVLALYQGVGGFISLFVFGLDMKKTDPNLLRLFTIAGQMLFILLPAFILSKAIYEDVTTIVRFKLPSLKEAGLYLIGLIILMPLLQNITYIQTYYFEKLASQYSFFHQMKQFFDSADKMLEGSYTTFFSVKSFFDVIIIVLTVSITPAVCEEFFFRGYIQKSFELKWKPVWGILLTSFVFALNHFSPYGLIPIFMLGIFLGYSAYKSNSILIPILLHFVNNFFMIILYFTVGAEGLESKPAPDIQINASYVLLILNSLVFLVWLYFARNFYKKRT